MFCVDVNRMYELQNGMTETAFAKKLGVSRSQLWRIRTGKSAVGAEFLAKFKAAFPKERIEDYFFCR